MKRGTFAAFGPDLELLPTFRYDCTYRPAFIDLYLRRLAALGFAVRDCRSRQSDRLSRRPGGAGAG